MAIDARLIPDARVRAVLIDGKRRLFGVGVGGGDVSDKCAQRAGNVLGWMASSDGGVGVKVGGARWLLVDGGEDRGLDWAGGVWEQVRCWAAGGEVD